MTLVIAALSRLSVRDRKGVRLRIDALRIGAAAQARIERVDRRDLVRREREIEDVKVLSNARRLHRFGNCRDTAIDVPAKNDLRRRPGVLLRKIDDDGIPQSAFALSGAFGRFGM